MTYLKTLALLSVIALALVAPAPAAATCSCVSHSTVPYESLGSGPGNPCPGMEADLYAYLQQQVSCPGQLCSQPVLVQDMSCRIYRTGWYMLAHLQWGCYEGTGCPQ